MMFFWSFFKKLSKSISKLMLNESNCVVLFWRSKMASNAKNYDLNPLIFQFVLHTIE